VTPSTPTPSRPLPALNREKEHPMRRLQAVLVAAVVTAVVFLAVPAEAKTSLTVRPRVVRAGGYLRIIGGGCPHGGRVRVYLDNRSIGLAHANGHGHFSKKFLVKRKTTNGRHRIRAVCDHGLRLGTRRIRVQPTYPATKNKLVKVSRTRLRAGQALTLRSNDCPGMAPTVSFDGRRLAVKATRLGKGFTARAVVPRDAAPGRHQLRAACVTGMEGTAELQVLDPAGAPPTTEAPAGGRAGLAVGLATLAGLALVVASLRIGRSRRAPR
jgi:hypothetical protein